jgi:hypothetical protein
VRRRTGVGVAWIRGGRKLELDKEENESEEEETTSRGCVLPLSCDGSRDRGPCKKTPWEVKLGMFLFIIIQYQASNIHVSCI